MTSPKVTEFQQANNGVLPAYAWPGGYPIVYYCEDAAEVCPTCAQLVVTTAEQWSFEIIDYDVYWEGETIHCSHCNKPIESAYGPVEGE